MKYPKYFPDVVGTRKSPLDSFIIAVSPLDLVLFQIFTVNWLVYSLGVWSDLPAVRLSGLNLNLN